MAVPVSALIVTWQSRADITACLESLRGETAEIIVVDNASGDGTVEHVRARHPTVAIVANEANEGFARGVNRAAQLAHHDFLLLLNPDARVTPGAVGALARALEADGGLGAVGGHLIDADGATQVGFTVRRFPSLMSLAADLLLLDELWPSNPWTRRYRALDLDYSRYQEVDQPAAACLLVRRRAFDALGGLDATFSPAWFEDVDFCRRLTRAGWRIAFVPQARVAHRGGASLGHLPRSAFLPIWYANMRRYVRRHHGSRAEGVLRGLIVAGMMLRMTAALSHGDTSAARSFARVLRLALRPTPTVA